ncbi:PHB depolymerase family esterase [Curtobacterium sp. MCBD17_003]|uniref:alpha/beta hydrolase family esterase n=1 Tax=Curtobacterium sp. MCBD17_003 TaxID=2175667 RepID=UPI000DAAC418|nr:PHB depolymerase family esterase [Curtobacterium sp. MCBD17_003]WIE55421.1 PHB depolymerase family esterase [Curtobacterium sp. MCBD17_003]
MRSTIDVDGRQRTMTIVGDPEAGRARDLVLVLHGSKQTGAKHRAFTGGMYDAFAASGTAVVVYLDGYRGNWNDARRQSGFPARLEGIDDVAFVRTTIRTLERSHGIDPDRVFVIGYSNGGQMAMRLVHEVPELLAGVTVVAATMPTRDDFLLPTETPATTPLPILLVHGTADPIAPYAGGAVKPWAQRFFKVGGSALSARDTAAYFARRNGISTPGVVDRIPSDGHGSTWMEQVDHREDGRMPVRLVTVHRGGHTVPGPKRAPFVLGRTGHDVSVAAAAAAFFGIGGRRAEDGSRASRHAG